jgi:hypothetical protein
MQAIFKNEKDFHFSYKSESDHTELSTKCVPQIHVTILLSQADFSVQNAHSLE